MNFSLARLPLRFVFVFVPLAGLTGCWPAVDTPPAADGSSAAATDDAARVLDRLIKTYRAAPAYSDKAVIRLRYQLAGEPKEDTSVQAVKFERPNRLSLEVREETYEAQLVCDGNSLVGRVEDQNTPEIVRQMLVLPAPERLSLRDLHGDDLLYGVYVEGTSEVAPAQLELLLADKPLAWAFAKTAKRTLLEEGAIDGRVCQRVQVDTTSSPPAPGRHVFWIDKESHVLRRLELPARPLPPMFEEARLQVDYEAASLSPQLADADFHFDIPAEASQVRFFVRPNAPRPVDAELYGTRPEFSLLAADGKQVTSDALAGKFVVLGWFSEDDAGREMLQQLDEFRKSAEAGADVEIYAVRVETGEGASPAALPRDWKIELPLLRDAKLQGRDVFHVQALPVYLVLNKEGAIQLAEAGVGSDPPAIRLHNALKRLRAGEDVAAEEANLLRAAVARFNEQLQAAMSAGPSTVFELPKVEILPPKDPQHLKLTKLWSSSDAAAPGNILPVETDEGLRLLVLDGSRTVVELDAQGRLVARHELPLRERSAVSFLRTAQGKDGRRWYAASFRMGKQAHLFDAQWKRVFSYPPEDQLQEGVRDVQLADLGADGEPELIVGFWGLAGAHAVSPLGETIWRNRTAPSIFSLAVTPPNELTDWRKLLVTGHERGILELNHFGRHVPPYTVADRRLQSLHPARYEGGDATYCGIADNGDGTLVAVGLAEGTQQQLVEIWNYRLPAMVSPQVEAVTSGQLLDGSRSVGPASVGPMPNVPAPDVQAPDSESRQKQGGQWLFAGSDGSLHAIGHDAGFFDYWRLGKPISGVAIVRINDQPAVIVSSDKEVTAWRVEPLAAKPQP